MGKKFHIEKILIPFDFSETAVLALEHAVFMAKLHKAEIYLLHVIESFSFASAISAAFGKSQSEFENKMKATADEKLKELAHKLHHDSGMKVVDIIENGKIYKKINSVAEANNIDIIVMGTHGSGGGQDHVVGSNTFKVVMNAPCPVISVQSQSTKIGFKNVLLPIDNTTSSRQKVKHAVEFARHYNSIVHIVGLMTMSDVDMQRKFEVKIHQVRDYLEEYEIAHTAKVFKTDNPATTIADYSAQLNADLIIIMTDQEGSGIFMGNAAQQIINHSKIPVMSIRPVEGGGENVSVGY